MLINCTTRRKEARCEVLGLVCVASLLVYLSGYVLSKDNNELCKAAGIMLFNCTTTRRKGCDVRGILGLVCVGSLFVYLSGYVLRKNNNGACKSVRIMLFNAQPQEEKEADIDSLEKLKLTHYNGNNSGIKTHTTSDT